MTNDDVAQVLKETADLLELTGGNPHRARAFSRAARTLSGLDEPIAGRLDEGSLRDVQGIGDGMTNHVQQILAGGSFALRDELLSAVPPGLMDVMRVKGLGTKRTRRLWTELGITSIDELEEAAEENRITTLSGFGPKTQQNILENIQQLRRYDTQWRLADAWSATASFLQDLRDIAPVQGAERTGALRRCLPVVDQAELLVKTTQPSAVRDWLASHLDDVSAEETTVLTGRLNEGIPLQVHLVAPNEYGTGWWRSTGAPDHCSAVVAIDASPTDHRDEESLYESAGLPYIDPALRENTGEVQAAAAGTLPDLITREDLCGCLHNHSTYSDGSHSLQEMALAARDRGFSYFGICDHSQSLRIANGLSPQEVREQRAEVNQLNEAFRNEDSSFRVFHGIESDILSDGSLDYESDLLASFDFTVASIHTGFSMTEEEATQRLIRAVENPHTRILGHPTGRLLLRREGYPIDHKRVIEACAEHDVALELNANPHRLDLDWTWIQEATDQGVPIAINPDAHAIKELDYVEWGVALGRKGWLTSDQCLNAMPLNAFIDWLDDGRP